MAISTLVLCAIGAGSIGVQYGKAQQQAPATETQPAQTQTDSQAPAEPVQATQSPACIKAIARWEKWYVICLKECEDIAASYTFKTKDNPATQSLYQRELNSCNSACDSKYAYYKDSLC